MWRRVALFLLVAPATAWIARQERRILRDGRPLSPAELADADLVGVRKKNRVRLLYVASVPPLHRFIRALSPHAIGLTARYGIFLRADYRHDRALLLHELAHTAQYERLGGIRPFLRQYLHEWLEFGYPAGALELEASNAADRLCV